MLAERHALVTGGGSGIGAAIARRLAAVTITGRRPAPLTTLAATLSGVVAVQGDTGRDIETARADLAAFNPQERLIDPKEVANVVLWLCSPASRSITGQSISVAGGEVV